MSQIEHLSDYARRKTSRVKSDPLIRLHMEMIDTCTLGIGITPQRGEDEDLQLATILALQFAEKIDFDLGSLCKKCRIDLGGAPVPHCESSIVTVTGRASGLKTVFVGITFPRCFTEGDERVNDYIEDRVDEVLTWVSCSQKVHGAPIAFSYLTVN